ncbi:MAG: YbgC/FadM family acyl-CoA thioesterase [Candidatus Omnitrophica bacterium]|nr:YbgC/FadM family acyl-CoA thioesterase [Candidatus Omnitrophota bacterium]
MKKKIYYHDTDAGGVVYYGTYLNYLEEARTEFLEDLGLSVSEFQKQGYMYAVRNCTISYKSPARYGETLICTASLKKMTAAQLIFDQQVTEEKSGRLIVISEITLVCLTTDFKPSQIPENLRQVLEPKIKNV